MLIHDPKNRVECGKQGFFSPSAAEASVEWNCKRHSLARIPLVPIPSFPISHCLISSSACYLGKTSLGSR